jgi:hypothetical protein
LERLKSFNKFKKRVGERHSSSATLAAAMMARKPFMVAGGCQGNTSCVKGEPFFMKQTSGFREI